MPGATSEAIADLDILIEAPQWRAACPDIEGVVRGAACAALATRNLPESAVSILLADDAAIRVLNRQFRGSDKPTNVLSFAAPAIGRKQFYGDVALGFETVANEAREQGKLLSHHIQHLIVHGVLHLLGFDHETDSDANAMESVETELLKSLGVPDPYRSSQ